MSFALKYSIDNFRVPFPNVKYIYDSLVPPIKRYSTTQPTLQSMDMSDNMKAIYFIS